MNISAAVLPCMLLQIPVPLPSTPLTEPWTAWMALSLGVLFVFALRYYPLPVLLQLLPEKTLRANLFDEQGKTDVRVFASYSLFVVGSIALIIHVLLFDWARDFSFATYGIVVVGVTLFFAVKYTLFRLVGYVFFTPLAVRSYIKSYAQLCVLTSACMLPVSVLYMVLPPEWGFIAYILLSLCILSSFGVLLVAIFRLFFDKIIACLYILLYLCTLEILPFLCLLALLQEVIRYT